MLLTPGDLERWVWRDGCSRSHELQVICFCLGGEGQSVVLQLRAGQEKFHTGFCVPVSGLGGGRGDLTEWHLVLVPCALLCDEGTTECSQTASQKVPSSVPQCRRCPDGATLLSSGPSGSLNGTHPSSLCGNLMGSNWVKEKGQA